MHVVCAVHGEINGISRTFYADDAGWVYEADVGRSFAGLPIAYGITLLPLNQKSPLTEKTYKGLQLEINAQSACTLYTSAEFTEDGETSQQQILPKYGAGLRWGFANWNQAYYGVPEVSRSMTPLEGYGTAVTVSIAGSSDNELPHSITAATILYIPRRITR